MVLFNLPVSFRIDSDDDLFNSAIFDIQISLAHILDKSSLLSYNRIDEFQTHKRARLNGSVVTRIVFEQMSKAFVDDGK